MRAKQSAVSGANNFIADAAGFMARGGANTVVVFPSHFNGREIVDGGRRLVQQRPTQPFDGNLAEGVASDARASVFA